MEWFARSWGCEPRRSRREHRARADSRRAVDMRECDLGLAGDLPVAGIASELDDALVDLPEARRPDRLAVRDAAAVGIDREPAADLRRAGREQRLLLAVLAEPRLGHVHHLGPALRVLELCDVDVPGSNAGALEHRLRRLDRRARSPLGGEPRAKDLERAEAS